MDEAPITPIVRVPVMDLGNVYASERSLAVVSGGIVSEDDGRHDASLTRRSLMPWGRKVVI